jgi:hypothetical protein
MKNSKFTKVLMLGLATVLATTLLSTKSYAQLVSTGQNVTLTVRLVDAIGIQVLAPSTLVKFTNIADYENGVTTVEPGALSISSTLPYELKVRSASVNLTHSGGQTIALSNINVQPTTTLTTNTKVALSNTNQTIATGNPAILKQIDLTYSTNAANVAFINKPSGDYTATLIYSVVTL